MTVHLDQWYNLSEVVAILSAQPQEPYLKIVTTEHGKQECMLAYALKSRRKIQVSQLSLFNKGGFTDNLNPLLKSQGPQLTASI